MRFTADGPSIPDELLNARDEDRVIFFCGAGVSRAKAQLPDFLTLTHKVLESLHVEPNDSIYQLLDADKTGHSLLSLDRIFGLLETDFSEQDIINKVAHALKPDGSVELTAHKTLLRLSTTSYGKTRLVTTNFDRLFEACDTTLHVRSQPKLPDPKNSDDFQGIIHLHGVVNEDYGSCDGNGFVLSSSEFGNAYLAEGWATQFIKSVLDEYIVVFVGYNADDPPIRYILEALNKRKKSLKGMYAFHNAAEGDAQLSWGSKGVNAIEYQGYETLWQTLECWADRADDPRQWRVNVLENAKSGPAALLAHERGQVAHIVSTTIGMQYFSEYKKQLPVEWLCVFDPAIRLLKPYTANWWDEERKSETITPFLRYGLDSDTYIENDDTREFPEGSWSAFELTPQDKNALHLGGGATVSGYNALHVKSLLPRLWSLGWWIASHAREALVVWWAVKQSGLHPQIVDWILRDLKDDETELKDLWHTLSDLWRGKEDQFYRYTFEDRFKSRTLNSELFGTLFAYYHPRLKEELGYTTGRNPPLGPSSYKPSDMVRFEVEYRDILKNEIPDALLPDYVRRFRYLIEDATEIEQVYIEYDANKIDPIYPEPDLHNEIHLDDGLSKYTHHFVEVMERLIDLDMEKAKDEYRGWNVKDNEVFAHLSVWICGNEKLFNGTEAAEIILQLNNDLFWDSHIQRDLLITLKNRWRTYPQKEQKAIEERILKGREKYEFESEEEYISHNAWWILERLYWLKIQGCVFTFDLEKKAKPLRNLHPEFDETKAEKADRSMQGRGGFVRKNRDCDVLLKIPIKDILSKSLEIRTQKDEVTLEYNPFEGLVEEKPVKAFLALAHAAKSNEYPRWAWSDFLTANKREEDNLRFIMVITRRVAQMRDEGLVGNIHEIVRWFEKIAKKLFDGDIESFNILWNRVIGFLHVNPDAGESGVSGLPDHIDNWGTYTINSPSGHLAEIAMCIAPEETKQKCKFYDWWLEYLEQLLNLPGRSHRYALVALLKYNLGWFDHCNPGWTQKNLMSFLESKEREDKEAFIAGVFRSAKVPRNELFIQMKPMLFELLEEQKNRNKLQSLAGFLLLGWVPFEGKKVISDDELRSCILKGSEAFRNEMLVTLRRWVYDGKYEWNIKAIKFINDVWPRQKSIQTSNVLGNLCDVLLADGALFIGSYLNVIELVRDVKIRRVAIRQLRKEENKIVECYPKEVLQFLHVILPNDAKEWWNNSEEILKEIVEKAPELKKDHRYIELQRRWDNRFR